MSPSPGTPDARILIGTPAYRSQVDLEYLHSVIGFYRAGLQFSVLTIGNESLITRARNTIVSAFYHSEGFTHLFFLDADVGIDGADLRRLVAHNRDAVAAPVPLKTLREDGRPLYNYTHVLAKEDDGLLRVAHVGTAALLLSRDAVGRLVEDAKAKGRVYELRRHDTGLSSDRPQYDVFQVGVRGGDYLSEDFWACQTLREAGVDVYVDATLHVRHSGVHRFRG